MFLASTGTPVGTGRFRVNISIQRKIDRWVGTSICRTLSLFSGGKEKPEKGENPRRILIILLSEMGSLILGYSMFLELKRRYPEASIHALIFEKNREVLELLNVIPDENILTINDESLASFTKDSVSVLRKMRNLPFDTVIDCELFARISSIFSFLSGASIRVGFHRYTQEGLYRGDFINRPVLYNPYHHIGAQFLTLVEAIESDTVPKAKRLATEQLAVPSVQLGPDEVEGMKSRIVHDFPGLKDRQIILLYPGGGLLPVRAWPLEHYGQLAEELLKEGFSVGVIGLKEDAELARSILSRCRDPHCVDLTGYTRTIRELLLIFRLSALLITNDGGPGQFSTFTAIPAIILYGPETPALYGTLNPKASNLFLSLSCSPCLTAYNHRNTPCDGDNRCLKNIDPAQVLAKAREMMRGAS
jgi:ADP-heptose:LPS heptosyltransferase